VVQDLVVVGKLTDAFFNIRENLSIGRALQSVGNVGHTALGCGEAVAVSLHLLVYLGDEAAKVLAFSFEFVGVRESLGQAVGGVRLRIDRGTGSWVRDGCWYNNGGGR
jgi:hypothetical protein